MSTNPDNLVKISLVESEISLLQVIAKIEKVTAAEHISPAGLQPGGLTRIYTNKIHTQNFKVKYIPSNVQKQKKPLLKQYY